ncbi:antitoxin VbhA family protein [Exiguobacterium sp. SH0S2]|uniref:antitoxin VbhA family protein n=1 Tax=Exiguobacterium sp. SH0S2 TaxID=2510950 RepID=UPI002104D1D4|nr:antitoxin VbhA family protein [Exiguobacterium sp. SH0S2]
MKFAVGMAAIDGGKPSPFTQKLLNRYENGEITSAQFKQAIMEQYTKAHQS